MAVAGYQIPIHQSLTQPILLAGVPRKFAVLNGTIAAALVLGLHSLWGIPVCLVIHIAAVIMTKKDPYFFEIMRRHIKQKSYYSA